MAENLKLTLVQNRTYEVGTFDGGTYNWSGVNTGSTNSYNTVLNGNTIANDSTTGEWYYTWYAATAGQGTNTANPTINRSICPKGWRLPNGGTVETKSYYKLSSTYGITNNRSGSTKMRQMPLSFSYSGAYDPTFLEYTRLWSVTPIDSQKVYIQYLDPNYADPKAERPKFHGFTIRCVSI